MGRWTQCLQGRCKEGFVGRVPLLGNVNNFLLSSVSGKHEVALWLCLRIPLQHLTFDKGARWTLGVWTDSILLWRELHQEVLGHCRSKAPRTTLPGSSQRLQHWGWVDLIKVLSSGAWALGGWLPHPKHYVLTPWLITAWHTYFTQCLVIREFPGSLLGFFQLSH